MQRNEGEGGEKVQSLGKYENMLMPAVRSVIKGLIGCFLYHYTFRFCALTG